MLQVRLLKVKVKEKNKPKIHKKLITKFTSQQAFSDKVMNMKMNKIMK